MTCSLVLLLGLCGAGHEDLLDGFAYDNLAAARSVWRASEETPDVSIGGDGDDSWLSVPTPFGSMPELRRSVIDRRVSLDLASVGVFSLDVAAEIPESIAQVSLYFRSGQGWYSGAATIDGRGPRRLQFSKSAFRIEGSPSGWAKVDGIRIALWRAEARDGRVDLFRLAAGWNELAVILPASSAQGSEVKSARDAAAKMTAMLDRLGLATDAIDEDDLSGGVLGRRRLAILAYNPNLSREAADVLRNWIEDGGKVFACYKLHKALQPVLGFGEMEYLRPSHGGAFAEIRFPDARFAGCPESVRQASWNITTAKPTGHGARVVGWWYDQDGNATGHEALLVSRRGAYFSHLVLQDDLEGKLAVLAAVLGTLHPPLWQAMADHRLREVTEIGHLHGTESLDAWFAAHDVTMRVGDVLERARQLRREGDFAAAVEAAREAKQTLVQAYLRAQTSPPTEGRAWWNHLGTGAYAGDWERSARELEAAGFNMILPNMLWGGVAHYASDVLPRSETFREHGDQIAQCLRAARRHGLEVHVWKVNWNLSKAPRDFVESMRRQGRTQVDVSGEPTDWLCPSHPKNLELEVASLIEVAEKYDVDGLHFDYIRYPNRDVCYCDGCRQRFEEESGQPVARWPDDCYRGDRREEYNTWRCERITRLVAAVSREARRVRPEIKISAAVFGSYPSCRESVAQDWPAWVEAGYLDFVCPMDYTESDTAFRGLVTNQLRLVEGRIPVYPGIGATASRATLSADRVVGQILSARTLGAQGFTIFNFHEATAEEILPGVGLGATRAPAATPHQRD